LKREKAQLRAGYLEIQNRLYVSEQSVQDLKQKYAKLQELYDQQVRQNQQLQNQQSAQPPTNSSFYSDRGDDGLRFDNFLQQSRRLSLGSISVHSNGSATGRSKVVPDGSGSLFPCADEEEFLYNESNFEEQFGRSRSGPSLDLNALTNEERLTEIQRRNSLVPPHLRSVYPSEYVTLSNDVKMDEHEIRVSLSTN